jgi:hypothetical protein
MEGPVDFTRAIFYVLKDATLAEELNEGQIDQTESNSEDLQDRPFRYTGRIPPTFEVTNGELAAVCGPRFDNLIWCHAQEGRVYLLVQTSAGTFGVRSRITDEQLDAARVVAAAYLELL